MEHWPDRNEHQHIEEFVSEICMYLENIFKIAGRKLFHLGDIVVKAAYCKLAKRRDLAESVSYVNAQSFYCIFTHTLHSARLLEHLAVQMLHEGCESGA